MQLLPNRFQQISLSPEEQNASLQISDLTFAVLHNKIAIVANTLADFDMQKFPSVEEARLEHVRFRAHLEILEELLHELKPESLAEQKR